MIRSCLTISLALAAASSAWADTDDCLTIADTASSAGLTALLDVVTAARPSLEESDEGLAFLAALAASAPSPADEQVTVFAPTNAAFTALLEAFDGEIPPEILAEVLLNHAAVGLLDSDAIAAAIEAGGGSVQVPTLSGGSLTATSDGTDIFVQPGTLPGDGATVVTADVATCAGVVHVVNAVLVPASVVTTTGAASPDMAPDMAPAMAPAGECTAIDATATEAGLTSLVDAITLAFPSLSAAAIEIITTAEPLAAARRVTVFGPSNEAFEAASDAFAGADADAVANVVLNHIISGELSAADITDAVGTGGGSIVVQTFAGSDLQVTTGDGGAVFVQSRGLEAPGALVTATDVPTCGGVVHVIDAVLLPTQLDGSEVAFLTDGMLPSTGPMLAPDMAPGMVPDMGPEMGPAMGPGMGPGMAPGGVLAGIAPLGVGEDCSPLGETAVEAGLTTLVSLLTTYEQQLNESDTGAALLNSAAVLDPVPVNERITVFAPTNEAFNGAEAAFGGELPPDAVPDVLLNHIVSGELTAEAILALVGEGGGSTEATTVGGGTLFVTTQGENLYVQSAGLEAPGALVTMADVVTCSGPVHVVNTVLLPSFPNGTMVELGEGPTMAPEGAVDPSQDRDFALPPEDVDGVAPEGEVVEGDVTDEAAEGEVAEGAADGEVAPDTAAAAGSWAAVGGLGVAAAVACSLALAL